MADGRLNKCKACLLAGRQKGHQTGEIFKQCISVKDGPDSCWEWSQKVDKQTGYGWKTVGNKSLLAHRWVWTMFRGPIPKGLVIDHVCRNRKCVNPFHLRVVTQAENTRAGENTKLTPESVREIRKASTAAKIREVASKYGIWYSHAYTVRRRGSWKNFE